jgi:predicted TPR repeat methyltransferase
MPGNNLKLANEFAAYYDQTITPDNWIGPQVLFMQLNGFLRRKSKILDLGIGTGASSLLFKSESHSITGIDGSEKMLEICKKKDIADSIVLHDLEKPPFPFDDHTFDAVISNGVFHLINPVLPVFEDVKRILKPQGYFAFTYEKSTDLDGSKEIISGIWEKKTKTGVLTYKHSVDYIFEIMKQNLLEPVLQAEFLAFTNEELKKEFYFTSILAKRQ